MPNSDSIKIIDGYYNHNATDNNLKQRANNAATATIPVGKM